MGDTIMLLIIFAILLILIFSGTPVFTSMGFTALIGVLLWLGLSRLSQFGVIGYAQGTSFNQVIAPMFIMMSEFLSQGGIAEDIFAVLNRSIGRLKGGLAMSTTLACTIFAALCGSSPATAAAIGKISISEMMKRNYSPSFAVGTVAAGGTLGIMIPPSITFCLYGIITETSIVRLFMAGILPGLLLSAMIIIYIVISTRLKPSIINWAPDKGDDTYNNLIGSMNFSTAKEIVGEAVKLAEGETGVKTRGATEKKVGFMTIIPALALIVIVLGSMYAGFATPLEAAGYGVVGALVILIVQRRLTLKILKSAMKNTARTGTMMVFLITCGMTMTFVISYLGISQSIATAIANSGMGRIHVMLLTYLLWFILGCLMDPASMLILTIPFLFQTLLDFGFDPVWIGVVSVLASQIAMITPPVGMNLFVLKTNSGLPMSDIIKGSIPFVLLLFVGLVVLTVFPQIALFLPSKIM